MTETDRLRNLVDRLLGPNQVPTYTQISIHEVTERVVVLMQAELQGQIEIIRDYDPSIPSIEGDAEQLIQAVLNVARNAMQALIDSDQKQEILNKLIIDSSSLFVKLNYAVLFFIVMIVIYYFANKAQISPWGRMMRAIRDNEVSANAMGKDIVKQHLIIFVIGAAIVGVAGAMLVTLDGLFTPSGYRPLRFTFIIWIMVIVGGSGNNLGAIFGGFVIWFAWIEVAPLTTFLINLFTSGLDPQNAIRLHLLDSVPYFRYLLMGMVLLLILRYRPKGIIPEKVRHS